MDKSWIFELTDEGTLWKERFQIFNVYIALQNMRTDPSSGSDMNCQNLFFEKIS